MKMIKRGCCMVAAVLLGGCALFGGDENSSLSQPKPLPTTQNVAKLQVSWKRSVGESSDGQYASLVPAIVGDSLFVSDSKGNVSALDRNTGEVLWETALDVQVVAGLGASSDRVFVGTVSGHLIALDANTGKSLWNVALDGAILAAPQTDGNIVVVSTHNQETRGIDPTTGKQLWLQTSMQPVLTLEGDSTPLLDNGAVFVGYANGHVRAMVASTGRILWDRSIALAAGRSELERMVDIHAQPLLDNNLLYAAAYQGNLVAIDVRTSQLQWSYKASSYRSLALDYGNLYLSQDDGMLYAIDAATGEKAWQQTLLQYRKLSAPVTLGDYVVVGDDKGYLYVFSQKDGALVSYDRLSSSAFDARLLVVDDETLYAYDRDGTVFALQLQKNDES